MTGYESRVDTSYGNVVTVRRAGDGVDISITDGGPHYSSHTPHLDVAQATAIKDALTEAGALGDVPAAPPFDTTGRGFYVYAQAHTVDGLVVRVAESSAASGPHVWLQQGGPDKVTDVNLLRFDAANAKRIRDGLAWHLADIANRWG